MVRPFIYLLCAVTLAACQPKPVPMTPQEAKHMTELTAHMTPRCVGRYVIDMPNALVLNSEVSTEIEGVKIEVRPMKYRDVFEMEFNARQALLERTRQLPELYPHLRQTIALPNAQPGGVFDRTESDTAARAGRTLELMAWRDGFLIKAWVDAIDPTFPEDAQDAYWKTRPSEVSEKLATLFSVYERLRGRPNDEIPTEAGFCFPNGFAKGAADETEETAIAFHLKGSPDVYFHFVANKEMSKERDTMLGRTGQIGQDMQRSGTKTVRKGKREMHALLYEEWLMKGPTPDRVSGTMFLLTGNETKQGAAHPYINLDLFNGFRIPAPQRTLEESAQLKDLERATLSEAEAVALWDAVTPTLRLRPGAF